MGHSASVPVHDGDAVEAYASDGRLARATVVDTDAKAGRIVVEWEINGRKTAQFSEFTLEDYEAGRIRPRIESRDGPKDEVRTRRAPSVSPQPSPPPSPSQGRRLSQLGKQLFVAASATPVPEGRSDRDVAAALRQYDDRRINVGDIVDYCDRSGRWRLARVAKVAPHDRQHRVPRLCVEPLERRHHHTPANPMRKMQREWLPFGSDCIAPRGIYTGSSPALDEAAANEWADAPVASPASQDDDAAQEWTHSTAPGAAQDGPGAVDMPYMPGDLIDVEDRFRTRSGAERSKWRLASVVVTQPPSLFIHWEGWNSKWDQWLDLMQEPERVAPPCTRSVGEGEGGGGDPAAVSAAESAFADLMRDGAGLELERVAGDGNCMFRAMARQVYGTAEDHDRVRQELCDYMYRERSHFGAYITGDFDVYVADKRGDGSWGDDLELLAAEELYDRPVEVYSAEAGSAEPLNIMHAAGTDSAHIQPLRLAYHGHSHYNTLIDPSSPPPLGRGGNGILRHSRLRNRGRMRRSSSVAALSRAMSRSVEAVPLTSAHAESQGVV